MTSRHSNYHFGDYNPYLPSVAEQELVQENLVRLRSGETSLEGFLKQTPQFPRWQDAHIRRARIMLITNEPGLCDLELLYGGLAAATSVQDVAGCFKMAMSSWLSLTDHPSLGFINGEKPWSEGGRWEREQPALAVCGKAGYFMTDGEETELASCKVLHLDLSAFPQTNGLDINPRNDNLLIYHEDNRKAVQEFCRHATPDKPRYIFIIANRAHILRSGTHGWRLDVTETPTKDRSWKIVDLMRVVEECGGPVAVRLCRQMPKHGRNADIFSVAASVAYELQPLSGRNF